MPKRGFGIAGVIQDVFVFGGLGPDYLFLLARLGA
jgi:hypothetical protein